MKRLYDMDLSGNCYKVRLLLDMLDLPYEKFPVDLPRGGNRTSTFLALNPRGEVPVLIDRDTVIWDSSAILIYLATNTVDKRWYPDDALIQARIAQWMAVAGHEIQYGLAAARAVKLFGRTGDLPQLQEIGRRALVLLDEQLHKTPWLAGADPTIADIACYPYVRCAEDGGISLAPYTNIQRWFERLEALPGYRPMVDTAWAPSAAMGAGNNT